MTSRISNNDGAVEGPPRYPIERERKVTTEIQVIDTDHQSEIVDIRTEAMEALVPVIKTEEEVAKAGNGLSVISTARKRIETMRTEAVKPLNDRVKEINAFFRTMTDPLENAEKQQKAAIAEWHEAERRKAAEAERERRRIEYEQMKAAEEAAAEKGEAPPPPPPSTPTPPPPKKSVKSDMATTTVKQVWDFEIESTKWIPRKYLVPDEKAIRAAIAAGEREIPGVRIFEKSVVSTRAR